MSISAYRKLVDFLLRTRICPIQPTPFERYIQKHHQNGKRVRQDIIRLGYRWWMAHYHWLYCLCDRYPIYLLHIPVYHSVNNANIYQLESPRRPHCRHRCMHGRLVLQS